MFPSSKVRVDELIRETCVRGFQVRSSFVVVLVRGEMVLESRDSILFLKIL